MQDGTLSHTEAGAMARLMIHISGHDEGDGGGVDSFLRRVRSQVLDRASSQRLVLALSIHDLQGQRLLELNGAGQLVDVALAPGTYHVQIEVSGTRRRYTVALAPSATFNLNVRLARNHGHDTAEIVRH